jgi:hypothetical protein
MVGSARVVKPTLSNDARDKLAAALNRPIGKWKRSAGYQRGPLSARPGNASGC